MLYYIIFYYMLLQCILLWCDISWCVLVLNITALYYGVCVGYGLIY